MNGKYTDLDLEHKKELLVNLTALYMATNALAEVSGINFDDVAGELWESAYKQIVDLSPEEIERSAAAIEEKHKPFYSSGQVVIQRHNRDRN